MKQKSTEKLSTTLTGISGEYFVAAELSRHGFIAAITLRNTRGIDILVSRPGGKKSAAIQVKAMQDARGSWLLDKSDETPKGENHYYVFVDLNGVNGHPDYFIVEGDFVAKWCAESHQNWLKGRKRDGGLRKDSTMRKFSPSIEHHNRWNRIKV